MKRRICFVLALCCAIAGCAFGNPVGNDGTALVSTELVKIDMPTENESVMETNPQETEIANDLVSTENVVDQEVHLYRSPEPDKVCIMVQPSEIREDVNCYYIPTGDAQDKLKSFMDDLEKNWQEHDMLWEGMKETGYQIYYKDIIYMVFEGGYLYATDSDAERGVMELLVQKKEICDFIQCLLSENLAYETIDLTRIRDIVSAKLSVCSDYRTNGEFYSQTITDKATLALFEDWFRNADYIFGGADCGNNDSCLELALASGETIKLSVATDSCSNFGVNGVYYDYRPKPSWDNAEFFKCFDEIPWEFF